MILGTGLIDVIYRLRGKDLFYHMEDCLFVLSRWEGDLFSKRGKMNLKRLANDRIREYEISEDDLDFSWMYPEESKSVDNPIGIWIERRLQKSPSGTGQHWEFLYRYAVEHGGGNLDDLVACRMQDILQNPGAVHTLP